MSEFVNWLNAAGDAFVAFGTRMGIQSSVLILALLALDLILRQRVKAVVRYWIWLLVLVKLVLPPSLSSPASLAWWLGEALPVPPARLADATEAPAESIAPAPVASPLTFNERPVAIEHPDWTETPAAVQASEATTVARITPPANALSWKALTLVAWLAVVLVMLALLVQRALFVRRLVLQSEEAPDRLRDLLDRCRRQMGVRTPARLRLTSVSASPSVCGLTRPTILVPQRMLARLDHGQLKSILLHELAHIRRADLWVNLAQTLLQIAYVYHPLVWLANAIIRRVREQAVDETVLAAMGDEAEEYPRTLLSVSKLAFDHPALSLRLAGIVESKKLLANRIRHITGRPFPTSAKLGLLGLVFVLAVAIALVPMAGRTQASAATPDEPRIPAQFKATLPNGLTVEVLGIRAFPGVGSSWWRPDGSPATGEEFPEFQTTDPDYTDPSARVRLLVIRLDGLSLDGVKLSHHLARTRMSSFYPRYQDDRRKVLQPIQTFVARFLDDTATADLKIGIAAGAWRDAAAGSKGHTTANTKDNITQSDVIYHPVQEENGSLHISATHLLGGDYDCRIVAEDEARNIFEPVRYSNTGSEMRLCKSVLDVPLTQVKRFRLQARPYEWVEFKGIPLVSESEGAKTILTGRVSDPQGKLVQDAEVTLYEMTPGELGVLPNVERIDRRTTGADGAFSFAVAKNNRTYREGNVIARKNGLSVAWAPWPMHEDHSLEITLGQPMELAGEVVDEAGRPVTDAMVHIAMAKIGKGENRRELRAAGFFQARTDRNGRFAFADMPAGATFEFFVEGPGRAAISTIDISSYSREQCQFAPGQAGIRLTLPAEARIEGVIVEKAGGKPLGGVEVAAHADRRGAGGPIPSKRAVTAPDGTFRIGGLAAGSCTLRLWTPRGQTPAWVAENVQVSLKPGETTGDLRMVLTKGAVIEAFIKDPDGKPVEKVNAHFQLIGQYQGFGERTDANGLARIRVLPGRYRVEQIYRPGYVPPEVTDQVTIEEGQTKRVEFIVTPTPKVAGIVRDEAGRPLAGVKVQTTWIKMLSSVASEATSDASGTFDIQWAPSPMGQNPDHVVIVARDPRRNLAQALDIDENTGPLDLKLKQGVIVTGAVLDQDGKPLPGANARVLLCVSRATVRLGWNELATAGPDGVFEARGIPPEREYAVEVSADGYGKREIAIDSLDPKVTRHDIGPVKLARSNLTVSGLVVDPNDEPVAGAEIHCFGEGQPDLRTVQTDAQGRFTTTGLSPGSVHLLVNPRGQSPLSGSTEAEAGATDVKITIYERRSAQARAAASGVWLKGKALPAMTDLGIDLPPDATGKMLLVCFYDIDQRPSRTIVIQLAKRAEELGDKGVAIVAVQSSVVDETRLQEWVGQNAIPFAVGRIRTDESRTRRAWGVRSLPWLILTDRDHIVRAEGFDLGELQDRIEAIESPASHPVSGRTGTTISGVAVDASGEPSPDAS